MPQPKRTETLERFKNGEMRLLVASDVAARGLDIKGMSHVFCFDMPIHAEDYVHRIGRTGRAGLSGRSFMLAAPEDGKAVAAIVKLIGEDIPMITVDGIEPAELEYEERRRGRSRQRRVRQTTAHAGANGAENRRKPTAEQPRPRNQRASAARPASRPKAAARPAPVPIVAEGGNAARFQHSPAPRRPREPERAAEPDRKIVGFGDHLPAFLARPPRIVARP